MAKVVGGRFGQGGKRAPRPKPHKAPPPTTLKPKQPSAPPVPQLVRLGLTDLDNADRFARVWKGKLAFAPGVGWMKWVGSHWKVLSAAEAVHLVRKPVEQMAEEFPAVMRASGEDAKKFADWCSKSRQLPFMRRTLELAEGLSELRCDTEPLDSNPYLLATPSGVVDLKHGKLIDPEPSQRLTLCTTVPYEEEAQCPKWIAYLSERLRGHLDVVGYVQRALGQGLVGLTGPHIFLLHGPTHCGKTTTLEVVKAVLGTYAATMPVGVLMTGDRASEGAQPFLASLRGIRFVKASESKATDHFEAHVLKLVTGSDHIEVRHLYREPFSMMPRFTVFLATNHAPTVDDPSSAIWTRLRLVPFEVHHSGHDELYVHKLVEEEGPGILRWLAKGAKDAITTGFRQPLIVQTRTGEYREAQDPLAEWLKVRCYQKKNVIGTGLRKDYAQFCDEFGYYKVGDKVWSEAMGQRFQRHPRRTELGVAYVGVVLRNPTPSREKKRN